MVLSPGKWLAATLVAASAIVALSLSGSAIPARAQVFGPPMTVFGSVTDAAGDVPADLPIEALIGDTVCGRGKTQYTGEGDGRVTVYFADVVSREQTPGCAADGIQVRIKVGDRVATQTLPWRPGPAQMDITFGDATPRPIPTFTPTPRPGSPTAEPPALTPTLRPTGTNTPGASPAVSASPSPSPSPSPTNTATATSTPTLAGGLVTTDPPRPGTASDGDGFPVWAIVVIAFGALAAIGGGIGYALARSGDDDDEISPAG